jgi:predicted metalloendopeptidase
VEKRDLSQFKNKTSLGSNQEKTFTRSAIFRKMTDLIQAFFDAVGLSDKINSQTPVVLRYSPFFDRMDQKFFELEGLENAGKRRLANYIGWRIITRNVPHISEEYRDAYEENSQRIQGQKTKKQKSAAQRCATEVASTFPLAVGAIYVRDNIPSDQKSKASMMINDIKLGFGELLANATWMDDTTYQAAVRKLDAMLSFAGFPDVLVNNMSAIDNEYKEVSTYLLLR